jgi:hypothetical protein
MEGRPILGCLAAAYVLVAVVTFGHAFARASVQPVGPFTELDFKIVASGLSAAAWPAYWSAVYWMVDAK